MKYFGRHEKGVIELFNLTPCRSSLKLHARRTNYIAKIRRQADQKIMVYDWMVWRLIVGICKSNTRDWYCQASGHSSNNKDGLEYDDFEHEDNFDY